MVLINLLCIEKVFINYSIVKEMVCVLNIKTLKEDNLIKQKFQIKDQLIYRI